MRLVTRPDLDGLTCAVLLSAVRDDRRGRARPPAGRDRPPHPDRRRGRAREPALPPGVRDVVRQPPADRPEGDAAHRLQGTLRQGPERRAPRLRALPAASHPALARHETLVARDRPPRLRPAHARGRRRRPPATCCSASRSTRAPGSAACASTSTCCCRRFATARSTRCWRSPRGARAGRAHARAGPGLPRRGARPLASRRRRGGDRLPRARPDPGRQPLPDLHALPARRASPCACSGARAASAIAVSAGRSILNRSSRANIGVLMSLHGGGGHAGAGACLLASGDGRRAHRRDRGGAQAEWMSARSGQTCPGSTTGRTSVASAWRPEGGLAEPDAARAAAARARRGSRDRARAWCGCGCSATAAPACARGAAGSPIGLDDVRPARPRRRARRASREAGLRALLVLMDFLWFAPARVESGVQLGGRRELVRDPRKRARLLERVFAPIAERCARAPEIAGLRPDERARVGDARDGHARPAPLHLAARDARLPRASSRPCVPRARSASRSASASRAPAGARSSTGCRSTSSRSTGTRASTAWRRSRGRSRRRGLAEGRRSSASSRRAGRRCRRERIYEIADRAGYSGALAWSALATDDATDGAACLAALRQATGHAGTARLPA